MFQFMPQVRNDFIFAMLGSPAGAVVLWLLVINLVSFLVFGFDKLQSKRRERNSAVRRLPEKSLILLAVFGGSLGIIVGMKVWRHKTLHKTFTVGVPLILALQILIPLTVWFCRNAMG